MHKLKKIANPTQRKLMHDFVLFESDLAFCDLVHSGWKEYDAAYYAYGLSSDNNSAIKNFLEEQKRNHPGIDKYLQHLREEETKDQRDIQRMESRLEAEKAKLLVEEVTRTTEYDVKTKQGMLDYLVDLLGTNGLDPKTRADLAKQITDLQQYKKEDIKVEDNRINFYLPITCKYCAKCETCSVRQWAVENGARMTHTKTNNGQVYAIAPEECPEPEEE